MAGLLQNEDHKTEAELVTAGGTKAQLLSDAKIYVGALAETLDDAISAGKLNRPGVLGTVGAPLAVTTQIDITAVNTHDMVVALITGSTVTINTANLVGGGFVGQRLMIIGVSGSVQILDGVNGPITFTANVIAEYVYNGTTFIEVGRNL